MSDDMIPKSVESYNAHMDRYATALRREVWLEAARQAHAASLAALELAIANPNDTERHNVEARVCYELAIRFLANSTK